MSNVRSQYTPIVRDGLCRHIRSKGMVNNRGETAANDSARRAFLAIDKNLMDWDGTNWWCESSGKTVGPDDRPCHNTRCLSGRGCFEAEDTNPIVG